MRILLENCEGEGIVGREYLFDGPEGAPREFVTLEDGTIVWGAQGEFILMANGTVFYRHDETPELFTNSSRLRFETCVHAWDKYINDVRLAHGEAEQLRVVVQLKQSLEAQGDLRPGSFWESVLLQAEWDICEPTRRCASRTRQPSPSHRGAFYIALTSVATVENLPCWPISNTWARQGCRARWAAGSHFREIAGPTWPKGTAAQDGIGVAVQQTALDRFVRARKPAASQPDGG